MTTDADPLKKTAISLDLSDPAQNLTNFMGAQSYGYETKSQPNATFGDLAFSVPGSNSDPDDLYDLHTKTETQRQFSITSSGFTENH